MLDIVARYQIMQFQGKLMVQTQENIKKILGANLGPLDPNLGRQIFFFKNLASPVTRYHGELSSCTIPEKTKDAIFRKFSDGWTDGRE